VSRQDQRRVSLVIDGEDTGVWDMKTGGMMDSEESKFRPGGMAEQVTLGGSQNLENLPVSRLFVLRRDLPRIKGWYNRAGKASVVAVEQYLDTDGRRFGDPLSYSGILKSVTAPEHDSESNDPAMVEVEVSLAGPVA